MDHITDHRNRQLEAENCLAQLISDDPSPSLESLELIFLNVIQNDLSAAKPWIQPLKTLLSKSDTLTQAVVQRLLGRYFENCSQHLKAIQWTQRALSHFKALNHQQGIGQCARLLFSAYAHLGQYHPATAQAKAMLALPWLQDEERLKITMNLGTLAYRQHEYRAAEKYYILAQQQLLKKANPLLNAIVVYNLGNLQVVFNQFGAAEKSFAQAQKAFTVLNQNLYQAHTLQAFGQLYAILGHYAQAESHLSDAKHTYRRLSDPFGAMLCDLEIIRMDLGLNEHDKILNAMPELLREFQAYGRTVELGELNYYGSLAAIQKVEHELAQMYLEDAEAIVEKIGDAFFIARCQVVRARLLVCEKQPDLALQLLRQAQSYFKRNHQTEQELACLLQTWQLNADQFGDRESRRLRFLLKQPMGPRGLVEGHLLLSDYWYGKRQFKRGLRALYTAVNTIEESRASIPISRMRRSFFEDKAEIYEQLLSRLLHWGRNHQLTFRVLQLSRGRQMSEHLSNREALPPVMSRGEPSLLALQKLDLQINRLNLRLESLNRQAQATPQLKENLLEDIRQKKSERLHLRHQLQHEERLGLFFPLDIKPEALVEQLKPNQLIVLVIRDQNHLYRMELGHQCFRTYKENLPTHFDRNLKLMTQILKFPIMAKMDRIPQLATELSKPLLPRRKTGIDHYIFILHKSLHKFPLALLRRANNYLIQTYFLSQAPNIAALFFTLKRGQSKLASPLFFLSNHAEDPKATERMTLAQKFPKADLQPNFSNKAIPKLVQHCDFIHFAGHCHFHSKNPRRSFLQLNNQRVYLGQIARWRLENTPFINLAACQSGQTALDAGNEPYGFVVSAIAAGASTVLASLWEIDDQATGNWMNAFYANIHKGLAFAYRQACLEVMQTMPQPYFWSGFALVGHADF